MSTTVSDDLRLVLLAAAAWLFEHDYDAHAEGMDTAIDKQKLVDAIDRLASTTGRVPGELASLCSIDLQVAERTSPG